MMNAQTLLISLNQVHWLINAMILQCDIGSTRQFPPPPNEGKEIKMYN